jgi:hypothetical protein
MRELTGFRTLREQCRITWIERERGWVATPEDMVNVLAKEGFAECKRETTTSRRDGHPAGGIWQGVDPRNGSVASAVWVNHAKWPAALVFIEVDGESLTGGLSARRALKRTSARGGVQPEAAEGLDPQVRAMARGGGDSC